MTTATVTATRRQRRWGYQVSTTPARDRFDVEPCDDSIYCERSRLTYREALRQMREHCASVGSAWTATALYLDGRRVVNAADLAEGDESYEYHVHVEQPRSHEDALRRRAKIAEYWGNLDVEVTEGA